MSMSVTQQSPAFSAKWMPIKKSECPGLKNAVVLRKTITEYPESKSSTITTVLNTGKAFIKTTENWFPSGLGFKSFEEKYFKSPKSLKAKTGFKALEQRTVEIQEKQKVLAYNEKLIQVMQTLFKSKSK